MAAPDKLPIAPIPHRTAAPPDLRENSPRAQTDERSQAAAVPSRDIGIVGTSGSSRKVPNVCGLIRPPAFLRRSSLCYNRRAARSVGQILCDRQKRHRHSCRWKRRGEECRCHFRAFLPARIGELNDSWVAIQDVRTKTLVGELVRVRMNEARPNYYEFGKCAFGYGVFGCEHPIECRSRLIPGA